MGSFQLIKQRVIQIWRRFVRQHRLIVYSRESDGRLGLSLVSWTSLSMLRPKPTQKIVDGPSSPDLHLLPNDFTCQVVWCDQAFISITDHTKSTWVEAATAAAVVYFDRSKPANGPHDAIWVIVVHAGFIEGSRFLVDPRDEWPCITSVDHRDQLIGHESFSADVRALAESLGAEYPVVLVEAPDISASQAEKLERFATTECVERLTPERLRREFAQTFYTRLRSRPEQPAMLARAGSLQLPVIAWGTVLTERFAVDPDGPGARRTFRLARDWAARTFDFTFEDDDIASAPRRFSASLPDRDPKNIASRVSLEFLASKSTGSILARLWSESHEHPICPICSSKRHRVVAETGSIKCLGCGQEDELTSLDPRLVRECLGVLRPRPTAAEETGPAPQPLPVAVCVGLGGKHLSTDYLERSARLVDDLYFAGHLDHVAVDWVGIGPTGRSFGCWHAEALSGGGFKALAEQVAHGRVPIESTTGLDESLRRALAPERWAGTIARGVLAIVVSGDGHDLGSTPTFRDAAKRWAWVLGIRQAVGHPVHWGAFVEAGKERDAVRQAVAHLVLLGRQARIAENLVRDWPGAGHTKDRDGSAALVIAAATSLATTHRKTRAALGVVAEELRTI